MRGSCIKCALVRVLNGNRVEETSVGESRDRLMRYYCNCERVRCDGVVRLRLMPDEMLQGSCIKCELVRVLNSKRQQARVAPREYVILCCGEKIIS